jgi:transketolase N-terminal domain/subunit
MNALHNRIIEISRKYHLSHLGSSLTTVNIIDKIFQIKKPDEPFILSCGHAGLALYVVVEKYYGLDAEKAYEHHGTHPHRENNALRDIFCCSTGSLAWGLSIATGMALADRSKNVYCLISDGESFEGLCYESANIIRKYKIDNLKVYMNFNGYSAFDTVPQWMINNIIRLMPDIEIWHTKVEDYGLKGLAAHYCKI